MVDRNPTNYSEQDLEMIRNNITNFFDFERRTIFEPELNELVNGKTVILLPTNNSELRAFNKKLGEELANQGEAVLYITNPPLPQDE